MFEELKKKTFKKCLLRVIILTAAGVVLTGLTATGAFYSLIGYVPFENLSPEQIKRQWVSLELKENYGCFMEQVEYSEDTNYSRTTNLSYVILTGDEHDLRYRYMAIRVPAGCQEAMDRMYQDNFDGVPTESVHFIGRIKKLQGEEYKYFKSYFLNGGFSQEEFQEATLPYYIQVLTDPKGSSAAYIFLCLAGLLLIIAGLVFLIRGLTGGYLKKLRKDISVIGVSDANADADYNRAAAVCEDVRLGRLFTYYVEKGYPRAVPNTRIMWAYQNTINHHTNGIPTGISYSVALHIEGWKNVITLGMPEAGAQEMLRRYNELFPWIMVGYSEDLKSLFYRERAQFLQLKYNAVDHI